MSTEEKKMVPQRKRIAMGEKIDGQKLKKGGIVKPAKKKSGGKCGK